MWILVGTVWYHSCLFACVHRIFRCVSKIPVEAIGLWYLKLPLLNVNYINYLMLNTSLELITYILSLRPTS